MRSIFIGVTLLLILTWRENGFADAFSFPGYGAESVALGGARVADQAGPASLAYNPAGLNTGTQQTTISYVWAKPSLYVERDPSPGLDAYLAAGPRGRDPEYHLLRFRARVNDALEKNAEDASLVRGVYFGIVVPLARERADAHTSLGFGVFLPQGKLGTIQVAGESAPYFVEFHDRNQAAVISAALGHDLPGGWSVGAGVVVDMIQAEVDASVYVPLRFALTDVLIGSEPLVPAADAQPMMRAQVAPRVRPIAGVRWAPVETFAIGLSFRDESHGQVDADGQIILASGLPVPAELPWSVSLNTHFQPRRVAGGVKWSPIERSRLQTDLAWEQWSRYSPPLVGYSIGNLHEFVRNLLAASGIADAGLLGECMGVVCLPTEEALIDRMPEAIHVRYTFEGARDILIPRVGAGWRASESLELLGGYYYRPSIESPEGFSLVRTTTLSNVGGVDITEREARDVNVLDNAQHGVSIGAGWTRGTVTVAATALYVHLVEKRVSKENNGVDYEDRSREPGSQVTEFGYPGYAYGGSMFGGMLQLTLAY
jgi:hypothetical protein